MLRRSCVGSKGLVSPGRCSTVPHSPPLVDYRYIKRFLCKLFIEVVVFRGCRVAGLSASSPMIREKKGGRKISEIYMPAGTSTGLLRGKRKKNQQQSKYLFALLLAANVLPPRELDCCNYHVEEASKPTLRAAD
ncbi:hypothetical protein HBI88_150410 [Parastagonospora nodorum]|nr:hypothetical protein HBI97_011440 [Parastagonospora nodorum]KAH5810647.1 hypothetical protein HBI94_153050 [Parastagonospora nodorum]KAH5843947.1 hypothetical protein HBI96_009380 [Parastagonospora nodorum]KAH5855587.1 hypothetical protein HBI91_161920 [Parastagonospora nodorum]KAH5885884.1 hypothetical protein HBI90_019120 [Parastagonospora nodorum]